MAFPTTEMSGYSELRERISIVLGRCQEQVSLDFKESQPWPTLKWRLLKTIMGMANLRDGGLILIGIAERGTAWELTGIEKDHLDTFDFDDIIDQLSKYASPQINIDIVIHNEEDKKQYLAIHVHQFNESPVLCKNNAPDSVKSKERLVVGEVYIRSKTGKPQTMKVVEASQLNELLELSAEFRARRMLQVGNRIGMVAINTDKSKFDEELSASPEYFSEIIRHPYWRVVFRPDVFDPNLIPSLTDCVALVEKARVQLRGWDFPHSSNRANQELHGSFTGASWIGCWTNFMGQLECWQLFQSGQFVHCAAVREAVESEWHDKLKEQTKAHLNHLSGVDWNNIAGFISLKNLTYTITEIFEFATRICQAGVYKGNLHLTLELHGIEGFVLAFDSNRSLSHLYQASVNQLSKSWSISSDSLIVQSADHSLKAISWLCECFGWYSPNLEVLRQDQINLLSGKL